MPFNEDIIARAKRNKAHLADHARVIDRDVRGSPFEVSATGSRTLA
jgi:hypothetical protein